MKPTHKTWWLLLLAAIFVSCDPTPDPPSPPPPPPPPVIIKEGLNFTPVAPDADKELTITFKAPSASPLYGYTGEVYIHIGVVSEGTWMYVPAEWNQNIAKCKMTADGDNVWKITITPSIRQWFGSGTTPVNNIGIVIRSADGAKKGIANDSFVTVTDNVYKGFQPGAIKNGSLPAGSKEGINIVNNSAVTFVLYDKDKNGAHKDFAHLVGDFNNWTLSNDEKSQMFRDETAGCWWITLSGLDPAKEYAFQYYVGTKTGEITRLADAYSEKILDPANDTYISSATYPENKTYPSGAIGIVSVFKIQKDVYNWKIANFTPPAADNLIIYEMLFRDFTSSGDITGALQKLDYLKMLGVNAIELMPVQEFDGNDSWGYNPCFFFALDKAYGSKTMYKQFIDACHERGMAVIFDVVYNHATGANPFAKLYWDGANNRTAANNPWFNVTAPHPYSVFHDFNHESPLVRNFVKRNLDFLLKEYNIDGFRFDLSKGFTNTATSESSAGNYDASRVAILKDYYSQVKATKPNAYMILEHFCDDKEETELSNSGMMVWRNMNWAYCQSAMGYSGESDFSRTYYATSSRPANSMVSYMESHDEERTGYKQTAYATGNLKTNLDVRMSQLATNAAFFFTVPGPKMIWQFGELGYDISIEQGGRTGKKPVKWDYYDNTSRKGLYNTYSTLIKLRKTYPQLFVSTATMNWKVSTSDWNGGRFLNLSSVDGKKLMVVGNFTNNAITASTIFPSTGTWYNYMVAGETLDVSAATMNISIPANSFKLYSNFAP